MSSQSTLSVGALLVLAGGLSLFGQGPGASPKSVFPTGKAEAGQVVFVEKGCHQCHSAGPTKLPAVELESRLVIELGGDVHAAWTRDDYARAIMDPNHLVSEDYQIAMIRLGDHFKAENSPMPTFADVLRVNELIDLVTFLDTLTD
jgi:mono/diheme cytochrome c family protein